MDNGVVTGFDTHEHLLRDNALYKEIYDIQTQDSGDFDAAQGGEA
jgi:ATP-binding cassette subfamily B protein